MHTLPRPSELLNIRTGWDREDYFADEALSFHSLWYFGRDPKLFSQGFFDVQETTDAMRMGTQLHTLVLEGEEKFNKENVLWSPPINDKTGKPFGMTTKQYTEAYERFTAENKRLTPYTEDEKINYLAMQAAILRHPIASAYLYPETGPDTHVSELTFRGEYLPGWLAKGSIDRYDSTYGIIDFKTCAEMERFDGYRTFERGCLYNGYLEQLAFYQVMFYELLDPRPRGARWYVPVTLIAAEKKPPFRVAVLQPDEETQSGARERIGDLLEQYMEAVESGNYESRYDEIITLHRS